MITLLVVIFIGLPLLTVLISPLFRDRFADGGRVLMIHSTAPRLFDINSIPARRLLRYLDQLQEDGFTFGSLAEAVANPNLITLTADDGYDDLIELWPHLKEKGIPLTVFIPTAFVGAANDWDHPLAAGKRRHLDREQIKQLADDGVEFGSHTHSHVDLASRSTNQIEDELERSKIMLEEMTGKSVHYLAYPFGKHNRAVHEIAAGLGYKGAFLSGPGTWMQFGRSRIPLNRIDNYLTLTAKLRPGLLSGAEYLKCQIIACFSHLTPIAKKLTASRSGS